MIVVDDAVRIRVIRALLGESSKTFATRLGVTQGALTSWEHARNCPNRESRRVLAEVCQKYGIMFMPSGMPIPSTDLIATQENQ